MKKNALYILVLLTTFSIGAQENMNTVSQKEGITVTFENEDASLDPGIQEGLTAIIFEVYPKLMKDFNPKARRDLTVKIDTAYDGVAYAHNGQITISSKWLHQRPEDLDLMTHEIMHIIQSYPSHAGPSWLTEGIADYVRYKYGVDNIGAGWSLPNYSSSHNYTNSYRITARFLLWTTEKHDENLIIKLDRNLRNKTYSPELWKKYTGRTLDELWTLYTQNPGLSLKEDLQ